MRSQNEVFSALAIRLKGLRRQKGSDYIACCPCHEDKNPSLCPG
ncbi:CHC2 zinc finger domain-containing protein [Moorella sp. Hama-1]